MEALTETGHRPADAAADEPLLRVRGLTKIYQSATGSRIVACEDVSFDLYPGEVLGIVGESGSGKSTVLQCLYQDVAPTSGEAYLASFEGGTRNLWEADRRERRHIRTHDMSMVYQNPRQGLNLMVTAGGNIAERLLAAEWRKVADIRAKASDYLSRTEVPLDRMDDFPAFFSGGMQQRVQIAKALANNPALVLLDELTTGLDVSVQAGVLDLVRDIQHRLGMTAIVVSHDLGVIRLLADRTLVMKDGHVVEAGLTDQILEDPQHPYTQLLVNCVTH
ncbi:MAG: peptide ABC transporter ATP-binding protein [Chloroflexota bacterium]